jgi:serine-type D-Ala-D-Ala endopeptidase (penicillin-binding protein 7)
MLYVRTNSITVSMRRLGQKIFVAMLVASLISSEAAVAAKHVRKSEATRNAASGKQRSQLNLSSDAALVVEQETGKNIYGKNTSEKKPIASITKLMTAMVVLDSKLSLDSPITITQEDIDRQRGSSSRLRVGTTLSRKEMLWLALMASENRAAFALARSSKGGVKRFVDDMNRKAATLGMKNTDLYGPAGLDARNVSTAMDLALMVNAAYEYELIRQMTTSTSYQIDHKSEKLTFRNTNRLVKSRKWKIGLSKTGYISDSGKCLVMQATIGKVPTIIILLDSWGRNSRIADAIKVKQWLEYGRRVKSSYRGL